MCRAGAGEEETAGVGDTPGFVLQSEPVIVSDPAGYNQLSYQGIINVLCSHHWNSAKVGEATVISRFCCMRVTSFLQTHLRLHGSQTMLLPMLIKETAH